MTHDRKTVLLILVGTLMSAIIALVAGDPIGALAGLPLLGVAVWQAVSQHRREEAAQRRIADLEQELRKLTHPTSWERSKHLDKLESDLWWHRLMRGRWG